MGVTWFGVSDVDVVGAGEVAVVWSDTTVVEHECGRLVWFM